MPGTTALISAAGAVLVAAIGGLVALISNRGTQLEKVLRERLVLRDEELAECRDDRAAYLAEIEGMERRLADAGQPVRRRRR